MCQTAPKPGKISILIPCYNEEATIHKVVSDFRAVLPKASIYVYDNNSTDSTAKSAREAGAIVRRETLQGKGNVVRRMFADLDADIYVLVDGDDTYDASSAPDLIQHLIDDQLDMVNAARETDAKAAYRPGHRFGNVVLSSMVRLIFGDRLQDMLSGYRILSRRFVKSFPAVSTGFEIETEMTVHALNLRMPIAEIATRYAERPEGSTSKLHTVRDGFRILKTIANLVREERPLQFFGVIFAVLLVIALALGWSVLLEFLATGLVPRFPTAILATGMVLLAAICLTAGLVLDTVSIGRREVKRLHYLSIPLITELDSVHPADSIPDVNAAPGKSGL